MGSCPTGMMGESEKMWAVASCSFSPSLVGSGWLVVVLPAWGSSEQRSDGFWVEIGGGHTEVFLSWNGCSEGPKVPVLRGMGGEEWRWVCTWELGMGQRCLFWRLFPLALMSLDWAETHFLLLASATGGERQQTAGDDCSSQRSREELRCRKTDFCFLQMLKGKVFF